MTKKFPVVNGHELLSVCEKAGFRIRRQKGSHIIMFRESDKRRVVIPVHGNKDIPLGTLRSIMKDAGLTADDLKKY